jgi:cytochrome c
MKKLVLVVMMAAGAAWAADAKVAPAKGADAKAADGGVKLDGAKLYVERTCVACHGKDAKTPILPEYPKLAGQNALYAERQINDIKSGARANGNTAAMKGVLFLVNEDEIKALAAYLASLK